MKVAGKRKERNIVFHADGALLREGALFNTEIKIAIHFPFSARRVSLQNP